MPGLERGLATVQWSPCKENYKNIPEEVAVLKTGTSGIFFFYKLINATNSKNLITKF